MSFAKVASQIDSYREQVVELQREIVAIPALSPTYDPEPEQCGEKRKVEFLKSYLTKHGITDLTEINAPDERVPGGIRPSLIARIKGKSSDRTTWVMAHTDVVPPGDMTKWNTDPWEMKVDGDKLFGRGVEDNHQGLVAGVMVARAMLETGTVPPHDMAILFVADEECGSEYGIQYVLKAANPFKPQDLIFVPDGGAADGSEIEVAEKSIMWIKLLVTGVQCHASMPDKGNNAMRAGAHLVVALDKLNEIYDRKDPVFDPPGSTFEPTKKEANVPNVNTIPGEDTFYLDCRILPGYPLEEVKAKVQEKCDGVAKKFDVKVDIDFMMAEEAAPATATDAPIVLKTAAAVKEVYGVEARPIGIGGGTVAAYLRRMGLPCVVWSKMEETMHGPNECALIPNVIGDAKVIAHVALSE
ncbi:MAG: M20 family metallo-hydrolase [Deltaproteobacteria bacterium]|nr:M20 family metallo-hydrolase [Deltaproteobacteria bacterium]